jgi:hypothetical protein
MVGGKVIETIDTGDKVWINCRGTGCEKNNECAIYVERTPEARSVSLGDSIWWQGRHAFWTPKGRHFEDRKLIRWGFSGVSRPESVHAA